MGCDIIAILVLLKTNVIFIVCSWSSSSLFIFLPTFWFWQPFPHFCLRVVDRAPIESGQLLLFLIIVPLWMAKGYTSILRRVWVGRMGRAGGSRLLGKGGNGCGYPSSMEGENSFYGAGAHYSVSVCCCEELYHEGKSRNRFGKAWCWENKQWLWWRYSSTLLIGVFHYFLSKWRFWYRCV